MKKNLKSDGVIFVIATLATETFGWGFSDPFFSAYANNILGNFFYLGLLMALKNIIALIMSIFISEMIKEKSACEIAIFGKWLSLGMIIAYFLAGLYFSIVLLIIAVIINAIIQAFRVVTNQSFLIQHANKKNASRVMGYNLAISNLSWAIGSILGGYLLLKLGNYLGKNAVDVLHYSFLPLIPFMLLGIYFLKKIKEPIKKIKTTLINRKILKDYFSIIQESTPILSFSILLFSLVGLLERMTMIFIPLLALSLHLELWEIGFLMAFLYIPYIFTFSFSVLADRLDRITIIIGGLIFSILPLILLSITKAPFWIAILSSLIALSLAIIQPANLGMLACLAKNKDIAVLSSLEFIFQKIGVILGAILLGFLAEKYGIQLVFIILAIISLIFALFALMIKNKFKHHKYCKKNESIFHHHFLFHYHHKI